MDQPTCRVCGDKLRTGQGSSAATGLCNVCLAEERLAVAGNLPSIDQIYNVLVHDTPTRRTVAALMDTRRWDE